MIPPERRFEHDPDEILDRLDGADPRRRRRHRPRLLRRRARIPQTHHAGARARPLRARARHPRGRARHARARHLPRDAGCSTSPSAARSSSTCPTSSATSEHRRSPGSFDGVRPRRPARPPDSLAARAAGERAARHQVPPPPGRRRAIGDGLRRHRPLDDRRPPRGDRGARPPLRARRPVAPRGRREQPRDRRARRAGPRLPAPRAAQPQRPRLVVAGRADRVGHRVGMIAARASRARAGPRSRARAGRTPSRMCSTSSMFAPCSADEREQPRERARAVRQRGPAAPAAGPPGSRAGARPRRAARRRRCRRRARPRSSRGAARPRAAPASSAATPDRARALDDELGPLEQEHHRLGDLVLADDHDVVDPPVDQRQRELARAA